MPRVPPVYPPPGASPIADAIRARRGPERGLSPLDGTLLQSPEYAAGWNQLLGAVRSQTSVHLPHDIREIIILRVAARNRAAFEWIQHEPVARKEGHLTDAALSHVRHTGLDTPPSALTIRDFVPPHGHLSELQATAVLFTDQSTVDIRVQDATFDRLRELLLAEGQRRASNEPDIRAAFDDTPEAERRFADRAIAEATATVATYNMVSRFLVALDIDGRSLEPVPGPAPVLLREASSAYSRTMPLRNNAPPGDLPKLSASPKLRNMVRTPDGQILSTIYHNASSSSTSSHPPDTIVCINSLMTDLTMWDHILPALRTHFHVITFDQRGHGHSAIPTEKCTLEQLSDDVLAILDAYELQRAHILGVSQGGATALAVLARHPDRVLKVIACDTQAASPETNIQAWEERIALARGRGMGALAEATLPRWFASLFPPAGSTAAAAAADDDDDEAALAALNTQNPRREALLRHTDLMIRSTPVEGFAASAAALQGYDLLAPPFDLRNAIRNPMAHGLLLLAGANDGALPAGLRKLADEAAVAHVRFEEVQGAGHLPMVDQPEAFLAVVQPFLLDSAETS